MGIKVAFLGTETAATKSEPLVTIPNSAVRTDGGSRVVFVVSGGDRVERRALRVGAAREDRVEVTSGLAPGERIVLDPPAALKDGARIVVR